MFRKSSRRWKGDGRMIQGRKVYDPLTNTWSTGYWVRDDHGNWYPVWTELRSSKKGE